jgi:hypothetical protein
VLSCDFEGEIGVDTLALAFGFDVGEHCTGALGSGVHVLSMRASRYTSKWLSVVAERA